MNSTATTCHLHPDEAVTGFCAACLRERLHVQEIQSVNIGIPSCSSSQHKCRKFNERQQVKELKAIEKKPGSLWLAASVFSKKLLNWRKKQKLKRQVSKAATPAEKPDEVSQRFGDAQSDMGLDALGRRSCDADPRLSSDAAFLSVERPRASCDSYFFGGGRSGFPRLNSMLSTVENLNASSGVVRSDGFIPVEEEDSLVPGGSAQTRDYYLHSSSRRRPSFDRSGSVREQPIECHDHRSVFSDAASPAVGAEFGGLLDRELRDWQSKTMRDDYFGNFESVCRDVSKEVAKKKPGRWSKARNIWDFLHPRTSSKEATLADSKSMSEFWPGRKSRGCNCKASQSSNNISFRHSFSADVGYGSWKGSNLSMDAKKAGKLVFDRNRSCRYSPSPTQSDNGMLRFYLTPTRNSWRNGGGSGSGRHISSNYFTTTMLGLY